MTHHLWVASGLLGWGAVVACSSSKSAVDAGPDASYPLPATPLAPLEACLQLAAAQASFEVSCGRLAESDVGGPSSGYIGAMCAPSLLAVEEVAFDAGRLAYSGTALNCLIDSLLPVNGPAEVSCNAGYPEINPMCGQLAWGTLGPGQSCDDPYACANGFYCMTSDSPSACGVCTPDVGQMENCGPFNNGALCNSGACNGDVCRPFVSLGQGCTLDTGICQLPLTCHVAGCQAPQGPDGGCGDNQDCGDGLSCNLFSSRCFAAPGDGGDCSEQPCQPGFGCAGDEDAGFVCTPLSAGGPCVDSDAGPECPELETCRDGGCLPLSFLGGSCGAAADCAIGACSGGACQQLPNGSPCERSSDCQSGACDTTASLTCVAGCRP